MTTLHSVVHIITLLLTVSTFIGCVQLLLLTLFYCDQLDNYSTYFIQGNILHYYNHYYKYIDYISCIYAYLHIQLVRQLVVCT